MAKANTSHSDQVRSEAYTVEKITHRANEMDFFPEGKSVDHWTILFQHAKNNPSEFDIIYKQVKKGEVPSSQAHYNRLQLEDMNPGELTKVCNLFKVPLACPKKEKIDKILALQAEA